MFLCERLFFWVRYAFCFWWHSFLCHPKLDFQRKMQYYLKNHSLFRIKYALDRNSYQYYWKWNDAISKNLKGIGVEILNSFLVYSDSSMYLAYHRLHMSGLHYLKLQVTCLAVGFWTTAADFFRLLNHLKL